ncbi:MAG: TonB-dependent receptor [Gammaproteobacteria bacterium]|nr:TonB-dependent receptor [Gammaproteobacteria bacterium]
MNRRTFAALAAVLCPTLGAAEEPARLDPLVVTATGYEIPARDALASITVITRDEIERALATDVAELLRFHAGLELGRNGGPGQTTSVFIRGGESNHTLVLVDGVRVNPASSGGAALQNIAPDMVERIEIVKGPRATLYGSDAIGGVINIITRAPAGTALQAHLRGGAHDTREGGAFLSQGNGTGGVALHAQRQITGGIPPLAGGGEDRGYRQTSVNVQGQTRVGGLSLDAHAWGAQGTTQYVGFAPADQDFRNQVVSAGAGYAWAPGQETRLILSYMTDDVRQNQSDDFVRTERPAAALHNLLQLGDAHRLSYGVEAAREQVDASSFGSRIAEDRDILGAFVQDDIRIGAHHALLALSRVDHDASGQQTNWNAEYGYDLSAATRLIAAAGTGFRAPDATDRYGFGGNPDLKPERARNYELGLRHALGEGQTLDARAFHSIVRDLISVECVDGCANDDPNDFTTYFDNVYRALNVDRYRNRGVELSYTLRAGAWTAQASALRQDPRSENRADPCSGEARLCRRAKTGATASVARRFGPAYAGIDVLGSGDRLDFAGTRLPGYALVNLSGGVEFARQWRLAARVENILDTDYQTAAGYNQPGTSAYLTLGWQM